ncbi:hypothetical protein PPYR_14524 [Photinus pyralis]|uniref:Uncharacterized protein n=1 Tax=Photinus pyralis TaxID=7054 RepID=A0A5N4A5G5_PHOPY|nr:hypothetical protein PPYR_14524 [Photinus pyralis]
MRRVRLRLEWDFVIAAVLFAEEIKAGLTTQAPSIVANPSTSSRPTSNDDDVTELLQPLVHVINASLENETSSAQNQTDDESESHASFPQSYDDIVEYLKNLGYTGTIVAITLATLLILAIGILTSYVCWKVRVCRETRSRYNRRPKYVSVPGDQYVYDKLMHEPEAEDI